MRPMGAEHIKGDEKGESQIFFDWLFKSECKSAPGCTLTGID